MVLRFISLAVLACAGTAGAQEPGRLPAKQPATKAETPAKQAPTTSGKTPGTSSKAPTTLSKTPSTLSKTPSTLSKTPGAPAATSKPVTSTVPGWLGFRTDPNDSAIIFEVAPDSPAERAGMRAGDRIVSSDQLAYTVATKADPATGAPAGRGMYVSRPILGRTYQMTLARGGETFDISMIAVAPPDGYRLELRPTRAPTRVPDTLRAEIDAYRTELTRTTLRPSQRLSTRSSGIPDSLGTSGDSGAARRLTLDGYAITRADGGAWVSADSLELHATLAPTGRAVTLLATRANAISGAEFEQLNPALGEYFGGISEGVFVLRVGAESPAAKAGLEPGDIVERVNGERVATIAALRDHVASTTGTITLDVIRKGRPTTVTLRKE